MARSKAMNALSRPITMLAAGALLFNIQSIDTMKDSRDMARSKAHDPAYSQTIDREMEEISGAGANYVAIDVPYDEEFVPMLERWVASARAHGLHVWFRGNLSGWEGWFGYGRIGREEHVKGVESFILDHPGLFADGDIFSACPECENGGPGDPRTTGDVDGYRQFLVNEYQVHSDGFAKIGKDVRLISSMNADVARLVMDKATTAALGGVVAIDDYRHSAAELESDILDIHEKSGGRVIVGEFGGPIPDLNGDMDETAQAAYIDSLMRALYSHADIIEGANYWTLRFGTTAVVRDDLSRTPALRSIETYFAAPTIVGRLTDDLGSSISSTRFVATLASNGLGHGLSYPFMTSRDGEYSIVVPHGHSSLSFADAGNRYPTTTIARIDAFAGKRYDISIAPLHPSLFHRFRRFLGLY